MKQVAEGTYSIQSWDQQVYGVEEPTLVRATVGVHFEGGLQGEASIEYLMTNLPDGSARYIGQIRFTGTIGGREGSVIFHELGEYSDGALACGTLTIVPGSGTGQLAGIRGEGAYMATHGDEPVEFAGRTWQPTPQRIASYVVEYDFDR